MCMKRTICHPQEIYDAVLYGMVTISFITEEDISYQLKNIRHIIFARSVVEKCCNSSS